MYFKPCTGTGGGEPGAPGLSVLHGNTAGLPPADNYGRAGEFFIDLDTYKMFGPKAASGSNRWANFVVLEGTDGVDGIDGEDGLDGLSAYQIAVANGFVGTEVEWLASLQGQDGIDGTDGIDGVDGFSAYEIAVANGFVGTEVEWLASLQGQDGTDGIDGTDALWNFIPGGFDLGASYAVGDIVEYEGSSWYRTNANGGNVGDIPYGGSPYWSLVALKGVDGANGIDAQWFWKGPWVSGAPYNVGDVVFHNGSSWIMYDGYYDVIYPFDPQPGSRFWELVSSKGDPGEDGLDGTDGVDGIDGVDGLDGKTVLNGSGIPDFTVGTTGDFYIDTVTTTLYGPKQASSPYWPYSVSLVGPQGIQGEPGEFGGALSQYDFDTNTLPQTGPTSGRVRLNNLHANLATEMYIHKNDINSVDLSGYIEAIDDSTSTIKGHFRMESVGTPGRYAYFAVVGNHTANPAAPSTPNWYSIPIQWLAGLQSTTFNNGEDVAITFVRTGNKGDAGAGGAIANNGSFISTVDQLNTTAGYGGLAAGNPRPMLVNSADPNNVGVSYTVDGEIVFEVAGRYNTQFSAQLRHTGGGTATVDIWFRKNGTNIDNSNTKVVIASSAEYTVASWNYLDTFAAGDKLQIMWSSVDADVVLEYLPVTNGRPAVPSVILTAQQVTYQGIKGDTGADGRSLLYGQIPPTNLVGANGDFYYDYQNQYIYGPKAGGAWPVGVLLKGSNGTNGTNGTNGNTVLNGSGAPSNALGVNGDFYIDTVANFIYGPKASGSWPAGVSMKGPDGADGADGNTILSGSGAPSNTLGVDGDFYYDTASANNLFYGPKTGGVWGAPVSLKGNDGQVGQSLPVGGTQNQVLAKNSSTDYDVSWRDANVVVPVSDFFGDGSDGDVVIGPGTTVLTSRKQYNNLTIQTGGYLNTGGYPISVRNVLTIQTGAEIGRKGNNGSNNTAGPGITAQVLGMGRQGGTGGVWSTNSGIGATGVPYSTNDNSTGNWGFGGRGGRGGRGDSELYTTLVGNNANVTFSITHGRTYNTAADMDVTVQDSITNVVISPSLYTLSYTGGNTLDITFQTPPALNQYRVNVYGVAGEGGLTRQPDSGTWNLYHPAGWLNGTLWLHTYPSVKFDGGTGGGGGNAGANTTNVRGGGGGSGGAVAVIIARQIVVQGTGKITARGGNGGTASYSATPGTGNGGGGGGGGGGVIIVVSTTPEIPGAVDVSGGTGGNKVGTGTVGATGAPGLYRWIGVGSYYQLIV